MPRKDTEIESIAKLVFGELKKTCEQKIFSKSQITTKSKVYFKFVNDKLNLVGYIGEDKATDNVIFIIVDNSRLKWAEKEGFTSENGFKLSDIYEKIGVIRKVQDKQSFINFLSGSPDYVMVGEYILH